MRSRFWRSVASMVLLALVAAACAGPAQAPETTGEPDGTQATQAPSEATGGTVRIGWGGAPVDLNPGNGVLAEDYTLYELVYDTPIGLDLNGDLIPELAESWEVSDDGLTWTLKIREGVTFHDGDDLTAEDIAFTLNLYQQTPDFPFLPSYMDVFTSIEAPDPTTVTLTTEQPIGNFESRMVFMYILPMHIWEGIDDPVGFLNEEMVGSGSFMLTGFEEGVSVELAANKEYWAGAPNIDGVVFQTFENPDARVQAIITGDIDMVTEFPLTAIPTLEGAANVAVAQGDPISPSLRDVFFNVVEPENCPEDGVCSGHPALRDVQVRRALAHAVDKQQLIDVGQLGLAEPGLGLVPTGLGDWFASELVDQDYAFDLAMANQILDEAGYVDSDGNGVRECPADVDCGDRGELRLRFSYPNDIDSGPRETELIQGWWREIGVETEITPLDPDTLTSICCPSFDYDVILWGWGTDPDPGFLLGVLLCDEIPSGFSETGYCDPAYDELYAQQNVEPDRAERREMVVELQRMGLEAAAYIIPYYQQTVQAYRTDRFTGWPDSEAKLALEDPTSLNVIRPVG